MDERITKLEELLKDQYAVEQVFVEDIDVTLTNLAKRGIMLTKEELAELSSGILDGIKSNVGEVELSEEDLENVAGGKLGYFLGKKAGFFHGYLKGGLDALQGKTENEDSWLLYKLGYKVAQWIGGR